MPIDLKKIPDRLTEAAHCGTLVPLIGAGISRHAKTSIKNAFPPWVDLLKGLKNISVRQNHMSKDEGKQIDDLMSKGKYLMAAQALRDALPADLIDDYIKRMFIPFDAKPGDVHRLLFKLKSQIILTTNYDMLLEDAYAQEFKQSARYYTFKNAPDVQRFLQSFRPEIDRPIIFKLHGSAVTSSEAVLSEMDYRNLLYREPGYKMVLSALFITKVVLMLGFSFSDPELVLLTETLRDSLKYRSAPDYILLQKGRKGAIEKRRLRDDFGLEVIEYTPSKSHSEVNILIDYLVKFIPKKPTVFINGRKIKVKKKAFKRKLRR